jgi:hypothetical protein
MAIQLDGHMPIAEAAARSGYHLKSIQRMYRQGNIGGQFIHGRAFIRNRDVTRLARKHPRCPQCGLLVNVRGQYCDFCRLELALPKPRKGTKLYMNTVEHTCPKCARQITGPGYYRHEAVCTGLTACGNCDMAPLYMTGLGLCKACYVYSYQNGRARPRRLWGRGAR